MSNTETIKIKYLGSPKLEQVEGSDWIDTYINEDVVLQSGEFKLIPLGFACQLPVGYEALVIPRSSTFKRYGVIQANGVGLIDELYCSNSDQWMMPVYATRPVNIPKGTRICQFRIQKKQPTINFVEVDDLGNKPRGGIGSTGV